ncbi:hypothetical protein CRE_13745 [Caenorhabditis remanei]|uniref:CCHC-type domain-containing protein n=1 Tax=Caenorhabditis remanei TaxID=31234 RepID=E3NH61_CAERE|nr:hypothetical protein CRE_13745 [Caenorhabditis remanei]
MGRTKNNKLDRTFDSGPLVPGNNDSTAQDDQNKENQDQGDKTALDISHEEVVETVDEVIDGVSLDHTQVLQPVWDTSALHEEIRETSELVRDVLDRVDSSEAVGDLVKDVLDRLDSPANVKVQEVVPLLHHEMKKIGKLITKNGEEAQATRIKEAETMLEKYEALVTKVMTAAQNQQTGLATTIVRSVESKMTEIVAPLKSEMSRIVAYIAGITQQNERPLRDSKERDRSHNSNSTAVCVFCEKRGHSSQDCKTILTPSDRWATARTKSICTKCLSKYSERGNGHTDCSKGDIICSQCSSIMADTTLCAHHEAFCGVKKTAVRRRQDVPSARAPKMAKYSLDNRNKAGPSGSAPQ